MNYRLQNTLRVGLMPWELVARRMSEKLGKPVTAKSCMATSIKAHRKLKRILEKEIHGTSKSH